MPTLSRFCGIIIQMYYDDHSPPHFHVIYNAHKAVITIIDYRLLYGDLPPKALGLVIEWTRTHRNELLSDWELARPKQTLNPIAPLELEKNMYFEIKEAVYQEDYKIHLVFEDGSIGIADLSKYKDEKNVFSKFQEINYFKDFRIEYGTLVWGDGELDIAPETLYEKATGKIIRYEEKKVVNN